MSKEAQIKFREETEIKRKAAAIFKSFGLDTSTAIRMFLRQVVRTRKIPLVLESGYTGEGERIILKAKRELDEDLKAGRVRSYRDIDLAVAALRSRK